MLIRLPRNFRILLVELRRVLKPSGSIYLHCDPTASHYLKLLMDAVFDPRNVRNEIIWQRTSAHSDARQGAQHFGRVHDTLLFYAKSDALRLKAQYLPHDEDYVRTHYPHTEPKTGRRYGLWDITGPGGAAKGNPHYEIFGIKKYWRYSQENMKEKIKAGRIIQPRPGAVPREIRYLDESPGATIGDVWTDIPPINSQAKERLGYPTQKPEALMERIIQASSGDGDLVLDPFCGCGTTVAVAQRLKRPWIGIDITHLAITLIRHRLRDAHGSEVEKTYKVIGEPVSLPDAEALAESDPYQFQWWALGLVGARPAVQRKGGDKGIDGRLYFHDDGDTRQIMFSVKGGQLKPEHLRDLRGVVDREKAQIGVLISQEEPTKAMRREAAGAGFYESPTWQKRYPRLQLLTVAELLAGKGVAYPPSRQVNVTYKRAPRARPAGVDQLPLAAEPTDDPESN